MKLNWLKYSEIKIKLLKKVERIENKNLTLQKQTLKQSGQTSTLLYFSWLLRDNKTS